VFIVREVLLLPCFVYIWAMSGPWGGAALLREVCIVCGLFQVMCFKGIFVGKTA